MANSARAGCTCVACENYREAEKSRKRLGLLPSLNVPHEDEQEPDPKDDRIADLERWRREACEELRGERNYERRQRLLAEAGQ